MEKRKRVIVANLIDWSQSFVDEDGSFYCGTREREKRNAAHIVSLAQVVVNSVDLHPLTAAEFAVNGGLYPVHNVLEAGSLDSAFAYMKGRQGEMLPLGTRNASPCLSRILVDAVAGRRAAVIVPRDVFFQGPGSRPFCDPRDIARTFKARVITAREFLRHDYTFITAPKKYFDASRLDSTIGLPRERVPGIAAANYNVYSLLAQKFPASQYHLVMINTGVVEGICRLPYLDRPQADVSGRAGDQHLRCHDPPVRIGLRLCHGCGVPPGLPPDLLRYRHRIHDRRPMPGRIRRMTWNPP